MSAYFREFQIALPAQIITDLGIPSTVLTTAGSDTYLRFLIEPDQYQGTYNHFAVSSVVNGYSRAVIRPVAPQRRISVECRESRLFACLAVKKLAEQAAIAAATSQPEQLIKVRDELLPDYEDYAAQVASSTPGRVFTERLGIIDASSIQMIGTMNKCGVLDIASTSRLKFDFIQSKIER